MDFASRLIRGASGRGLWGVILTVAFVGFFADRAFAASYEVNSLNDPGSAGCDITECTFREAITAANGDGEQSSISFSTAGDIQVASQLPSVLAPLTIDGTTAPGWSIGDPKMRISGVNVSNTVYGLRVGAQSTIRGIGIVWFKGWGLQLDGGASGSVIQGNTFGEAEAGRVVNRYGITSQASNLLIGGDTAADRNIFIGGGNDGIGLRGGTGNRVIGNFIGNRGVPETNPRIDGTGIKIQSGVSGTVIERNVISGNMHGISVDTTGPTLIKDNLIGTTPDGNGAIPNANGILLDRVPPGFTLESNTIAYNLAKGVYVGPGVTGVDLTEPHIHSNKGLGIDIESPSNDVNPNDPLDADTGGNDWQNFPEIDSALYDEGKIQIKGVLESVPDTEFRVSFYANRAFNPKGYGEGEYLLGETTLETDEAGSATIDQEFDLPPDGAKYISAVATNPNGSTSEFGPVAEAFDVDNQPEPDYRVTNRNAGGIGSLPYVIRQANREPDLNTITFGVAGGFYPAAALPAVTNPVVIDGLSAPGASTGEPTVYLDYGKYRPGPGLDIRRPSTVRGIAFSVYESDADHSGTGLRIGPGADGSVISNNWIGSPYAPAHGNGVGVEILADEVQVESNLISSNKSAGILVSGREASITSNKIGTGLDGRSAMPNATGVRLLETAEGTTLTNNQIAGNSGAGVLAAGVSDLGFRQNRVGIYAVGITPVPNGTGLRLVETAGADLEWNRIYGNNGAGVEIEDSTGIESTDDLIARNGGDGVELTGNQSGGIDFSGSGIHTNNGLGIDLGDDGVTDNDQGDVDTGPNGLQNHPALDTAVFDKNQVEVAGRLDSTPGETFRIRFFANAECDVSGFGEGEAFLGETSVTTGNEGEAQIRAVVAPIPVGKGKVSALAVSPDGSVSEFGNCITATPAPPSYEVKSLADDGDGICDSTCTLRDAIITSNQNPNPKTMTFKVAGTITPAGGLPPVSTPVTIDGLSAPGATAGSATVEISGLGTGATPGLTITGPVTIQGLKMSGYSLAPAVRVTGNAAGTVLRGNRIGDVSGTVTRNQIGVSISSGGVTVGGTGPGDANVIAGSLTDNLLVTGGSGISVIGNYIGNDPAAPSHSYSGDTGIRVNAPVPGMRIGGAEPGAGNVISGLAGWGLRMTGASGVTMEKNVIGQAANGMPLGNGEGGILLEGGTTGLESRNDLVAFNNGPGIRVEGSSTANDLAETSIHSNSGLGIDLRADGVSFNDPLDVDSGPNGMQNFPVLVSAEAIDSGIRVTGEIDLPAAGGVAMDFYASAACDATGHGEGERFLGTLPQYFDKAGVNRFSFDLPFPDSGLRQITATATGADGTSEFSSCLTATGFDPAVIVEIPKRVKAIAANGKTFIGEPEKGQVMVTFPGGRSEVLSGETEIPVGTTINATSGQIELTSADPGDTEFQTASFWAGSFRVTQKSGQKLVNLDLAEGRSRQQVCRGNSRSSRKVLRKLWGRGKGRFKTKGNRGAAGVRGTHWLTADRCDGTLVSVRDGVVEVRDFVKKATVVLRKGESYLARNASGAQSKSRKRR